jgi:hypothetical protein
MCIDALVDHAPQVARDQRRRLVPAHVVEARHAQRSQFEHVAKALGRDEPHTRAFVLEDGVGGDGRSVPDLVDGTAAQAGLGKHLQKAIDDRFGVVADAGRDLLGMDGTVAAEQHDVGEGAADVDPDTESWSFARHGRHSAALGVERGSCHCTFGTPVQPRELRMAARARSVAAVSTVQPCVSMTTP